MLSIMPFPVLQMGLINTVIGFDNVGKVLKIKDETQTRLYIRMEKLQFNA